MKRQLLVFTLIFSALLLISSHHGMGQAVDLPFVEDFETYEDNDAFLANSGWRIIDVDGDGNNWYLHYDTTDEINVMASRSFGGGSALTPENYLITPQLNLPELSGGRMIRLAYRIAATGGNYYEERYKVVVSTTGATAEDFAGGAIVFEETLTSTERGWRFALREVDLSAFSGQAVYIAFVHYDCSDQDRIVLNEVSVEMTLPAPKPLPFAEDFEAYEDTDDFLANSGWIIIDADGDGNNWYLHYDTTDEINVMASRSYGGGAALTPENYLVTPFLALPELEAGELVVLRYEVAATGNNFYEENYKVVVSTTGASAEDFAEGAVIFEETLSSAERGWRFGGRELDLSAFAGQQVFLAFVHVDCTDLDRIVLNNVAVEVKMDVSHDLPFSEDFQSYENTEAFFSETEWTSIDTDDDGNNWFLTQRDGLQFMASESWASNALEPENYLVTPQIKLPADPDNAYILLSYDIAATGNTYFAEHYKVVVSTTGNAKEDFVDDHIVLEETLTDAERGRRWARRHVDLAAYAGESVYIAFVHYDCSDNDMIILNNVAVRLINSATIAPESAAFNPMAAADITTTIFWFGASQIVRINDGSRDLVSGTDFAYTAAEDGKSVLSFSASYLTSAAEGLLQLTIHFDTGSPAVFDVDIARTPESATILPGMVSFDPQAPANAAVTINWGDATAVTSIAIGEETISAAMYTVNGNQLSIMTTYLAEKEPGYLFFTVGFDQGAAASFVVRVFDHSIRHLPFSEDFMGLPEMGGDTPEEWLPNGWRAVDANNDGQNWYWVPVNVDGLFNNGRMQSRSAVQIDGEWQALTPDNWLITPHIKLNQITGANQTIELTFRVAPGAATPGFRIESYEVLVSYTDLAPTSFDELYRETISQDHPQNTLLERKVELSFYEGQDVYIAFRHHGSTDKDRLLFSNVKVVFHGDDTSVQDPFLSEISVFPNPVRDLLTINAGATIHQVEMVSILGNVMYRQDVNDNHLQFSVHGIPEGVYFLRAYTNSGTIVRRVQVIR